MSSARPSGGIFMSRGFSRFALRLASVLGVLVLLVGPRPALAINGFSPNQELPLPLTAGSLPVRFIVRGLEPRTPGGPDGAVYLASIPGGPRRGGFARPDGAPRG